MRIRFFALLLTAVTVPAAAHAQMRVSEIAARPSLYVETGGGSTMVSCCSLNVEFPVTDEVVIRAATALDGLSAWPNRSVLFAANRLVGAHGTYLEFGGGLVVSTLSMHGSEVWRPGPSLSVGVRAYQRGTIYRFALTPILPPFAAAFSDRRWFVPSIGLSIGRTF